MNTCVTLNSGYKMPLLGLGTYLAPNEVCEAAVETAIKAGYRMIDTAVAYGNQVPVGNAVKKCIEEGIIKRDEIFITTKLWLSEWQPENVKKTVERCLKDLQVDYIDLLLIHQSVFFNLTEEDEKKRQEGDFFDRPGLVADDPKLRIGYNIDNLKQTWGAMEECVKSGALRSIGVSNFSGKRLRDLLSFCTIKPAVNQVELHPYLQQWETKKLCDDNQMYLMAYYPLGGADCTRSTKDLPPLFNPEIKKIAEAHGKTPAQILIRWAVQRGTICIPKSVHAERIIENSQIYDFILTDDEMSRIRALDKGYRFARRSFLVPSPYDWKDLWDGEYLTETM